MNSVFECKKCGQCCRGRGGIVLAKRDLARLAAFLGLSEAETAERHALSDSGKLKLKLGADGSCIFFQAGVGCGVHAAKPDVCRAWPFFRGNIEDPYSFAMAREYCQGIGKDVSFECFSRTGLNWLAAECLIADENEPDSPNALKVAHMLAAGKRS